MRTDTTLAASGDPAISLIAMALRLLADPSRRLGLSASSGPQAEVRKALRHGHPRVSFLRFFLQDRHGAVAPLIAFGLMAGIYVAELGIDYARLSVERQFLEIAADAAALAAAARLPDADSVEQAALDYVDKNMPEAKYGTVLLPDDIQIGTYDSQTRTFTPLSDPSDTGTAVRVTTRLSEANGNAMGLLFGTILGSGSQDLGATAIAGRGGPPCILVLDSAETSAMRIAGSASVETTGCGVQVNSTAAPAFEIKGKGALFATDICVGGASLISDNGTVSPSPSDYCPGQSDPLPVWRDPRREDAITLTLHTSQPLKLWSQEPIAAALKSTIIRRLR